MSELSTLPARIQEILGQEPDIEQAIDRSLSEIAGIFQAVTATVHFLNPGSGMLHLVASRGIPEKILPITQRIPVGKGMAGLCAERKEPVEVCNLQTDDSGQAKPGAKLTRVEGGIVFPVFKSGSDEIVGTLGVGKKEIHEYSTEEKTCLEKCAINLEQALITHRDNSL